MSFSYLTTEAKIENIIKKSLKSKNIEDIQVICNTIKQKSCQTLTDKITLRLCQPYLEKEIDKKHKQSIRFSNSLKYILPVVGLIILIIFVL